MHDGRSRRQLLAQARLYLCLDASSGGERVAAEALAGGVDMLQLRDKQAGEDQLLAAAERLRQVCQEHGGLFWINDRPDLAIEMGADGVHVGQDDVSVAAARAAMGPDRLVGLSTHSPEQLAEGLQSGADELSVGPVWETPTKPGRPAAGLELVSHAAAVAGDRPWFAIGGIGPDTVEDVLEAGARRIVVVRAIRDAAEPRAAAAQLRAALERRTGGAA
jgi:thiamine-phosphate pyrophosphorylase